METRDKEAVKTIGETGGLGTVATRADIIEKLFHSFMMEKKGNEIHITSKAKQLLELVPEDLKKARSARAISCTKSGTTPAKSWTRSSQERALSATTISPTRSAHAAAKSFWL